ncbi:AMP-binding protein, partial [Petrachloros mirabilis]
MNPKPRRLLQEGLLITAEHIRHKAVLVTAGRTYSYGELADSALRLASGLRERGVHRGDRVAIYMENTWPCVVSIFGVLLAGGVFVVINPQTKSDKLRHIVDDSDAVALLADVQLAVNFLPTLAGLHHVKTVICTGNGPTHSTGGMAGGS